jgi:enamine deaminase RidA (YjgF/YER057c/UK114 family)
MIRLPRLLAALSVSLLAGAASAQEVVHHRVPDSDVPISQAVEIPDGRALVFLSSFGPFPFDGKQAAAPPGDTKAQTVAVLKRIEDSLARLALTHADVVKMQVFLVADPKKGGKIDLAGFTEGYRQFYGTPAQPNLPTRSLVQVAGLVNPGWLVQIEVTAVRPKAR